MLWILVAGWLAGWILLWRLPVLTRPPGPLPPSTVSVIVPARNEADRLPLLLACLERQTRRPDEIVVVDDHSSDATAAQARAFAAAKVVAAPDLPQGWTGKSWACATGVGVSRGDVLVFVDADVELEDDALEALLSTWAATGGLLSVQPHHRIVRPFETLSLPFNIVAVMGLGIGSLLRPRRQWGAAGPCLVTDRASYEELGGHRAIRSSVAEDLALAERYGATGRAVNCIGGGRRISFRMYRTPRALFEGWAKNIFTGATRAPVLRTLGVALWVTAVLTALQLLLSTPGAQASAFALGAAAYGAVALQLGLLGRQVGSFGPAALAWPILMGFFAVVFVWSAVKTFLFRQVRWSGRTVPLGSRH